MRNSFSGVLILLALVFQVDGKALTDASLTEVSPAQDPTGSAAVNSPILQNAPSSGKKGLTFVKEAHLVDFGIDLVGCRNWSDPNGMNCDAYVGDTDCNQLRPVLCAKVDNTPRPAYFVPPTTGAMTPPYYAGWNLGHITTTVPVQGSQFYNRAAVDAYCAQSFGVGWRVALFDDGFFISGMNLTTYSGSAWTQNAKNQQRGGWHFYSYGDVRNDIRFWVHIRDQPSTCWQQ
ncbi:unnamed protein product [Adineta steineri]|uniref:Uncharacterized protein n=1 Tax=Adineta steineri TaxID=433720 RepID=A0A814IX51_9BILA|nr:unnamed protein product [Adineta steineri]CAF3818155.1 unnamed protein product [Adineta steineri]